MGREAARARFAAILRDNPTYASTVRKVGSSTDFVVIEYDIAMNPPAPFALGRFRYTPTGAPYVVPAIDVIRFRDGLVSEKVTFLDTDTIRAEEPRHRIGEPRSTDCVVTTGIQSADAVSMLLAVFTLAV